MFAALNTFLGILILCLSLPLIYRKVPMNDYYGVRIQAAFKSEKLWYEVNAYGGRLLAKWSILIIASGVIGFFLSQRYFIAYQVVETFIILIAVLAPLVQVMLWARQFK